MPSMYATEDYAAAGRALMPRGAVWPDEPGTEQAAALSAIGATFQRLDAAALGLIADSFPGGTVDLLPEWEDSLGLPDPCAGTGQTRDQRRAQVLARLIQVGGASRRHFLVFASSMGVATTIISQSPFHWKVTVTNGPIDPTVIAALECEFERMKPAHTTIEFVTS